MKARSSAVIRRPRLGFDNLAVQFGHSRCGRWRGRLVEGGLRTVGNQRQSIGRVARWCRAPGIPRQGRGTEVAVAWSWCCRSHGTGSGGLANCAAGPLASMFCCLCGRHRLWILRRCAGDLAGRALAGCCRWRPRAARFLPGGYRLMNTFTGLGRVRGPVCLPAIQGHQAHQDADRRHDQEQPQRQGLRGSYRFGQRNRGCWRGLLRGSGRQRVNVGQAEHDGHVVFAPIGARLRNGGPGDSLETFPGTCWHSGHGCYRTRHSVSTPRVKPALRRLTLLRFIGCRICGA